MKRQIIIIHGGEVFRNRKEYISFLRSATVDLKRYSSLKRDWKGVMGKRLGKRFEVLALSMPNKLNAQYGEWKIWFEKIIPFLKGGVVFVGHSLGGMFLVKYLSENKFPKSKKVAGVFLVAAPFGAGNFSIPKNFRHFAKQSGEVFLYHSRDDRVVPVTHVLKFKKKLPSATVHILKNRGHFNKESFPELIQDIRKLS